MSVIDKMHSDQWDIGETLDRDVSGKALREIRDLLEQQRFALKRELDRGVTPDEFRRGEALLGSFDAALSGLEEAWQKRHG